MSTTVVFEDLHDQVATKIGRYVQTLGFVPASITGIKLPEEMWGKEKHCLGVLLEDSTLPRPKLFGLIPLARRLAFPGIIWFVPGFRKGVTKDTWLIEVQGDRYVEEMRRLGNEISMRFEVKCIVRLVDARTHVECLPLDDY